MDKSGKVNTNVTVTENGTFDKEAGSKDTIEKNGKTYKRVGEATVKGRGGERANMQINDVNINATSQDLTKGTGAINYNGLSQGGRTWIIEQKLDGTYGKYVVANTPSTVDDAWVRDTYLAGENTAKDFNDANTKADGGIGENDNVIIMEKSVYVTSETHENGLTLAFGTSIVDTNKFDGRNIISELIDNEPGPDAGGTIKQMAIYRDFDNDLDHGVDKLYEITRGDINSVTGKVTKSFISKYKEFLNITGWDDTKENFIWYLASVNFNKSGDVYSNEFVPNSGFISDRTQFRLVDIMKNKDNLDKVDSDNRPTREFNMFNDPNAPADIQTNISEGEDRELHNSLPESDNYLVGLDTKDKLLVDKSIELLKKRYAQYNENTPLNYEDVTTWIGNSALRSNEESYTYNTVYTPLRAYRLNDNHMTVTYTYEEEQPKTGSVVVKYETKNGVQLKEPVTVKDDVEVPAEGVRYSTMDNAPDKLTDSQGNVYYLTPGKTKEGSAPEEGNVETGKTLEVTYIYEPAGNVVVHYKNLDTGETLKDDLRLVDNSKAGDNYTTLTEETKLDYIDKEGKRYSIVFNQVEGDETGNVESGVTKEITYYYTEEKKARLIVNYYKEGTEEKLLDSKITENLEVGSDYITRPEIIDAVEEEIDEDARRVEKIKRYELVDRPMNDTGTIVEGDNVVNYYYREVNTENIYSKQALVVVNHYKEGTTEKLAPSVDKGRMDIGSKYTTEGVSIPSKTETEEFDDRTVTKTKTYELVKEPENKEGLVPKEGAIVNYFVYKYTPVKKGGLTVNYYKENSVVKLAESEGRNGLDVGSEYTTEAKVIEPKTVVDELPDRTVTRNISYELVNTPENAQGKISESETIVNYYYREVVKEDVSMKKDGLTVNFYKEGTKDKLADSIVEIDKVIGSDYTTISAVIPFKVVTEELPDRTVTRTISYELVKTPENANGKIVQGGTIVNYYYREIVKEDVNMKKDGLTVNFYKEGTKDKLADSVVEGDKVIGSDYTTTPKEIQGRVENEDLPDRTVKRVISYVLTGAPENAKGKIVAGGNVVDYYYREVVKEDITMKKDGVVANYYKVGTKEKLAESEIISDKAIGSDYTTAFKTIEPKVTVVDLPDKVVRRTVRYELVERPFNENGKVVRGGTVVDYYYKEIVDEEVTPKKKNSSYANGFSVVKKKLAAYATSFTIRTLKR